MDELPPPFVTVSGLANLRDIGGWSIVDESGKPTGAVRKGILYRGPNTAPITDDGLQTLKEIGITTTFDLRSKPQIEKAGGARELEGIRRVWCPVFDEVAYSAENAAARYKQYSSDGTEGIVEAFTEILECGASVFRKILLHVGSLSPSSSGNPPKEACLITCTTGNNRTGVFIGVILSFLGVPEERVATEYTFSDLGLASTRHIIVARLASNPVFSQPGGGGKALAERMIGARKESMLAMLEMVKRRWGGAEQYLKQECKMTDEELDHVRKSLIDPDADTSPYAQ